jgi:hypothetical protein
MLVRSPIRPDCTAYASRCLPGQERQIVQLPRWNARRLKRDFDLPYAEKTLRPCLAEGRQEKDRDSPSNRP